MMRTRFAGVAVAVVLFSSGVAMGQLPRSRGPADPRYFPDLCKGPAWGMTLSEYYTFGNKADGPYGYALSGYRYGSHDDITRWTQATGTAIPPGYYLQRLRERRGGEAPASPSTYSQFAQKKPTPAEIAKREELTAEAPAARQAAKSSRRNAQDRGVKLVISPQPASFTGPDQSEASTLGSNKIRRIRSTDPPTEDDKN